MSERGAISPERDEIVGERGAELSGAVCCDFERWSEHPRERGAGILTAQLRSHALPRANPIFFTLKNVFCIFNNKILFIQTNKTLINKLPNNSNK